MSKSRGPPAPTALWKEGHTDCKLVPIILVMLRDLKMIGVASNLVEAHRQRDITEIISIEIIRLSSTSSTPSSQKVIFYFTLPDFSSLVKLQVGHLLCSRQ
jgi:hypothetical protein